MTICQWPIGPNLIITERHGLDTLNGERAFAKYTLLVGTIYACHNHSILTAKVSITCGY